MGASDRPSRKSKPEGMEGLIEEMLDDGFELSFSNNKDGIEVMVSYQPIDERCGKTVDRHVRMDVLADSITLQDCVETCKRTILTALKQERTL
jgi:hypothetical protein